MNKTDLLLEGLTLMGVGMGFVILFLLLLIFAIEGSSRLIQRLFPKQAEAAVSTVSAPVIPSSEQDELDSLRPVIAAAIAHHRRQQGLD